MAKRLAYASWSLPRANGHPETIGVASGRSIRHAKMRARKFKEAEVAKRAKGRPDPFFDVDHLDGILLGLGRATIESSSALIATDD